MHVSRLQPYVLLLALVSTGACFRHADIDGDKLECTNDDNCLAGYICTSKANDTTETLGKCVKATSGGAEPGPAIEPASLDAEERDLLPAEAAIHDTRTILVDSNSEKESSIALDAWADQAVSGLDEGSDWIMSTETFGDTPDAPREDQREVDLRAAAVGDLPPEATDDAIMDAPALGDTAYGQADVGGVDLAVLVDCGPLNAPVNGFVQAPDTSVAATAVYSCRAGFEMVGIASRVCLMDGTWSGNPPTCQCVAGKTNCGGVCVDTSTDNGNCGICGNSCVATPPSTAANCNAGRCLVTLASGQGSPLAIAVDSSYVYWTVVENDATVKKVPIRGGTPVSLGLATSSEPFGLAIDSSNAYWTDYQDGTVRKIPLIGGPAMTLATGQGLADFIVVRKSTLYWTNATTPGGSIMKLALSDTTASPIATNQRSPQGLAVDSNYIYWSNHGTGDGDGEIRRASQTTGASSLLVSAQKRPYALAIDGSSIYWSNLGDIAVNYVNGSIMKSTLAGSSPTPLVKDIRYPEFLAVDGNNLYWIQANAANNCTIMKVDTSGGTPTAIALQLKNPIKLAIDSASVYWVDNQDGTVMKVTPK